MNSPRFVAISTRSLATTRVSRGVVTDKVKQAVGGAVLKKAGDAIKENAATVTETVKGVMSDITAESKTAYASLIPALYAMLNLLYMIL